MTNEELIMIANDYLAGYTMEELGIKYGVSKPTIVRNLSGKQKIKLPSELQEQVDARKQLNWITSKANKGNLGHYKYTIEEVREMAMELATTHCTLRELGEKVGANPATLFNNFTEEGLGRELYEQVQLVYKENKELKAFVGSSGTVSSKEELASMLVEKMANTSSVAVNSERPVKK